MFIGAYWQQRSEARDEVAVRVARFLTAVASQNKLLSNWFLKGQSAKTARVPLVLSPSSVATALTVNRRDLGGETIPDLGFRLGVWNGDGVSLELTVGVTNPHVQNSVVLSFDEQETRLTRDDWKGLLDALIRAFDPEHAVVTSSDLMKRSQARRPWDAGWFTYERGREIQEHPAEM